MRANGQGAGAACVILFAAALSGGGAHAAENRAAEQLADLDAMSIEELGNIEVTSVSKRGESLKDAAAAIYVITAEDIRRSGATSIPEMLRLAPNLQVARTSANSYGISARGFNGTLTDKLLVLIDGRSVYTPLFGGVYWDRQDVMAEDIQHIEVISGPDATLWGANAVNGVINIITRTSADTQGGILDLGLGTEEHSASLRYGGRLNDGLTYRMYAKGFRRDATDTSAGASAKDKWSMAQGGFRVDWAGAKDSVTVQGDIYDGAKQQAATIVDQSVSGRNLLARWEHHFDDDSGLRVQAYYDRTRRFDTDGFVLDIYDFDVQHTFALGSWNNVVWGGGYRIEHDHFVNDTAADRLEILPVSRALYLSNVFAQDTISIGKALKATLGLKLENDPYSGLEPLPNLRLSWGVTDASVVWAAVSRAVRAPTRFDRDLIQYRRSRANLIGGADFQAEKLWAFEVGTRLQLSSDLSVSLSTYYNAYDDLRSIELPATGALPVHFANLLAGDVYGLETWANYQVRDWWRVAVGFSANKQKLHFKPGSSGLGGLLLAGNDPGHQVMLRSDMNFTKDIAFTANLRFVGALRNPLAPINPPVPNYAELNGSISWAATDYLEIALSATNLLHERHLEFAPTATPSEIGRSVFLEARWKF